MLKKNILNLLYLKNLLVFNIIMFIIHKQILSILSLFTIKHYKLKLLKLLIILNYKLKKIL
jgi:hypothetical protein